MSKSEIPDWVVYPQEKWEQLTPAQAGFDAVKFDSIVDSSQVEGARWEGEVHEERDWGAVLTRGRLGRHECGRSRSLWSIGCYGRCMGG